MTKGPRDRRQAAGNAHGEQAALRDHLPALRDHLPPGGGNSPRTRTPDRPPNIDDRAPAAARGRETRGEVETATMPHLEESEQGPK